MTGRGLTDRRCTTDDGECALIGIAAVARNGVIGADGDIPWRIPGDWRRFKTLTLGHALVMGRRTFDSIGRPLPGRTTVVVTRDPGWAQPGVLVGATPEAAVNLARDHGCESVFVAGGGEVYRALWPQLGRLEITEVDQEPVGEVRFPTIAATDWEEVTREPHEGYSFVGYRRRPR